MEIKNLATGIVVLIVGLMLAVTVLVPVVSDATEVKRVFSNADDSYGYMEQLNTASEYVLVWDTTTPAVATVNGKEVPLFLGSVVCQTNDFVIRFYSTGSAYALGGVGNFTQSLSTSTGGTVSITISGGNCTMVSNPNEGDTVTTTRAFAEGYAISSVATDWVMKAPTQEVYMNADSIIYAEGVTAIDSWNNVVNIQGNIEGVTVISTTPHNSIEFSNIAINADEVSGWEDLYSLTSITFDALKTDKSSTVACTYSYFVVPAEVTAEKSEPPAQSIISLVGIIPLLVVVGLVLGAIGMFISRRD